MKRLILILILTFSFQSWTKADDIKDFEIEGMSIGDSLLDYMTVKEIKNADRNYVKNKKYYVVGYYKNLKTYETMDIYLKSGDNKYIVRSLGGTIFMDVNKCLLQKDIIVNELKSLFPNSTPETNNINHIYDKSGKSKQHQTVFMLINDDHVRVECVDWSKKISNKNNWQDNLVVASISAEILLWIESGYK
jgi:hypothetical protein